MSAAGSGGWLAVGLLAFVLLALMLFEAGFPIHHQPREPKGRLLANFGLGMINATLFSIVPLSTVIAATWAQRNGIGLFHMLAVPGLAAFALTIALRSLAAYALHVAAHRFAWLWRMHRVHHADTAVDLSTGFRHHPLELGYVAACHAAIAAALGLSPEALVAYEAGSIVLTMWTHANLRLPRWLEGPLGLVLVTPPMHHVHHSARREETDSNYGELLSWWDALFGTLRRLDYPQLQAMPIGLGSAFDRGAGNLLRQLALPFSTRLPPPPVLTPAGPPSGS